MHPRTKRKIAAALVAIAVLVGLRMTLVRPFDSAEWIALGRGSDLHGPEERRYMYVDLRYFQGLKGLGRDEVIGMLGSPVPHRGKSDYDLLYPMGRAPMSLKTLYLGLKFENDVVVEAALTKSAT